MTARSPIAVVVAVVVGVLLSALGCSAADEPSGDAATSVDPAIAVQLSADAQVSTPAREALVQESQIAIERVEQVWGQGAVERPVRVVLAGTDQRFVELTGLTGSAGDIPAAVTVGATPGPPLVVVHPDLSQRLDSDGRIRVMTHEITHLVLGSAAELPWWLSEGVAEYTAIQSSGGERSRLSAEELDQVIPDRGDPPRWPPQEVTAADRRGSGRAQTYAVAWLSVEFLIERAGQDAVLDLARDLASGSVDLDAAVIDHLGTDLEALQGPWSDWWADLPVSAADTAR